MPSRTDNMNHLIGHNSACDHAGGLDNNCFFLQDFFKNPCNRVFIIFKFFNNFDLLSICVSAC